MANIFPRYNFTYVYPQWKVNSSSNFKDYAFSLCIRKFHWTRTKLKWLIHYIIRFAFKGTPTSTSVTRLASQQLFSAASATRRNFPFYLVISLLVNSPFETFPFFKSLAFPFFYLPPPFFPFSRPFRDIQSSSLVPLNYWYSFLNTLNFSRLKHFRE